MTEHPVISLEDVRKSYGNFELGPIDLEVAPGHIVAVVGPNGSGKSTLFGILMDLVRPDSGNVALFGRTFPRDEVEIKQRVSYLSEHATGDDEMSANSLGAFVSNRYPRWNRGLYRDLLMRYEVDPHKKFGELSRGVQRRLSFALALAAFPDLLLLDEPTAGVDPFGRKKILEDISRFVHRDAGVKTVVFSTQVMEETRRIADHVVLLTNGESLGLYEKGALFALLDRWKTFWVEGKAGADVPGVVEIEAGSPTRVVTHSPEKTAKWFSSQNVRIVRKGPVDLETIFTHLSRVGAQRGVEREQQ